MSIPCTPSWKTVAVAVFALPCGIIQAFGQQTPLADPATPAAPPLLNTGTVTLPYSEWKTLWEAAQPKPVTSAAAKAPAPPVAFSVQSARYEIDLGPDAQQANGKAAFEIANFTTGWTTVPLLSTKEVRLVGVEPEGTLVTVKDGIYTLLLDAPGRRVIGLRFSTNLADGGLPRTRTLRLTGPSALVNDLSVTGVPDGWLAEVQNASPSLPGTTAATSNGIDKKKDAPVFFQLAADLPIMLTVVSAQDRKPAPPPVPSPWQAEAQSLVRYDEGQLVYKTRLRLDAETGTALTAQLALPITANILAITGADLDRWRVVKSPSGDSRQIEVSWKTPDILRRELMLEYELPQALPDGDWHLVAPQIVSEGGHLRSALYALPVFEGTEFLSDDVAGTPLTPGLAQQLPRWLADEIGGGTFETVNFDKPAPADKAAALVRVRRLPLIRTARATVEESRFHTRLVADGALLSEGTMSVLHDGPVNLTLTLPADAQLLSCSISGHDTLPVDRGQGRIDLSLPAGGAGTRTLVSLSYTGRLSALAPVAGQIALSLPETDLFVQTMLWDLQIPAEYELSALEGNVSILPSTLPTTNGPPLIHLRKELLKGERPTAELFYQKRAVAP
jgi:hypothetical protein